MSEIRKTHLANSVEIAEAKSQLDENAKHVLGNKQVLAWIVKYTVEEFRDYELKEIENCIEGEPEIGTHNIYPGKGKSYKRRGTRKTDYKCGGSEQLLCVISACV